MELQEKKDLVTIKLEPEIKTVYYQQSQEVTVLVNLTGAPYSTLERNSRAPVDIVAVIDRSSSMKDKIPLVQETIKFMVKQLKAGDHLGLVFYDHNVDILLPLVDMDVEGKYRAMNAIGSLSIGGQTNTSGGLLQGLDMIRKRNKKNDVSSVLLFTDGLANLGLRTTPQISKALRGVLGQIDAVCSVFTFGYGEEPDPEYLKEIADISNGMYYHIKDSDSIPLAFTDCLGGLLSVVAQKLEITLQTAKGVTLIDVKTIYKKDTVISGSCVKVLIDDIYSEEQKDLLCIIQLPAIEAPKDADPVLDADLTFINVITHQSELHRVTAVVNRSNVLIKPQINVTVDKQKNRIICADAMKEALSAGTHSQYTKASEILQRAEQAILTSPSAQDTYCVELVDQLKAGRAEVQSKEKFISSGRSTLSTTSASHYHQRSTHSYQTYQTSSKMRMTQDFKNEKPISLPVKKSTKDDEREKLEKERIEKERLVAERLAKEKSEKEKLEAERLAIEKSEKERLEAERLEKEKSEKEKNEIEKKEAENENNDAMQL